MKPAKDNRRLTKAGFKTTAQLPALLFLFALLILWQIAANRMNAAYILPTPIQILEKIWELRVPLFTVHLPATFSVTAIGLICSLLLGLLLAVAMDASESVRKMLYPVVVVSQTIPVTAIAPLFVFWFGYGIWGKVVVTVLITFFPITITVYDGLRSAQTEMTELLETYGATRRDIFLKIKVPCTLPYFFSSVKMAMPLSIIGAAIGEWLGAQSGLGYFSRRMMTQLDVAGVFAPIVLLSVLAVAAVAAVTMLEKIFVRWRGESS
jgi:putative hydroxymethylpyrimidine transport system permease protein